MDYGAWFKSKALLQRLGYLLDRLNIPADTIARDRLLTEVGGNTKCYLRQPRRWKIGGDYNATWRVVENIPHQELLAEIEVR